MVKGSRMVLVGNYARRYPSGAFSFRVVYQIYDHGVSVIHGCRLVSNETCSVIFPLGIRRRVDINASLAAVASYEF